MPTWSLQHLHGYTAAAHLECCEVQVAVACVHHELHLFTLPVQVIEQQLGARGTLAVDAACRWGQLAQCAGGWHACQGLLQMSELQCFVSCVRHSPG